MAGELRRLGYFVVLAEELNFRRVAERPQTAQPGLSQQIKVLEQENIVVILASTPDRPGGSNERRAKSVMLELHLDLGVDERTLVAVRR